MEELFRIEDEETLTKNFAQVSVEKQRIANKVTCSLPLSTTFHDWKRFRSALLEAYAVLVSAHRTTSSLTTVQKRLSYHAVKYADRFFD